MLNDDENGNPKWDEFEQRGTQWREFKCGKTRYQLSFKRNWLLDCVPNSDKVWLDPFFCFNLILFV